jgi:hypothetical protein
MSIQNVVMSVKKYGPTYLSVNTAALMSTPALVLYENAIAGMSDAESLKSRAYVIGATYLGLGIGYAIGRNRFRAFLKATKDSSEIRQQLTDAAYGFTFNLMLSPVLYLQAGVSDIKTIASATLGTSVIGACTGPVVGYSFQHCQNAQRNLLHAQALLGQLP